MSVNFSFMRVTIERLERVLQDVGVKKEDFMSNFNLSKQNYQHWKERGIPGNKIIPICDYLEISSDQLTGKKTKSQAHARKEDRQELYELIDKLPAANDVLQWVELFIRAVLSSPMVKAANRVKK